MFSGDFQSVSAHLPCIALDLQEGQITGPSVPEDSLSASQVKRSAPPDAPRPCRPNLPQEACPAEDGNDGNDGIDLQ
jgi:hypothetical protein